MKRAWSQIICGGAGWKKNGERRYIIDRIKENLEMFRDFDNPEYLHEAKRLMEELN